MRRFPFISRGFSLTEVVIAIGILSFCLIAIVGLMPAGLKVTEQGVEEGRAMQTLAALSTSLRTATSSDGTNFTAARPFTNLSWRVGGSRENTAFFFTEAAAVSASSSDSRQLVFISLVPPTNGLSTGTAYAGVAWPGAAAKISNWTVPAAAADAAAPTLGNQRGYVSTAIIFTPNL